MVSTIELTKLTESVDVWELNKANAEDYLDEFAKQAWPIIEPGRVLIWNWHLDTICQHLEAVTRHEIQNLIINIPPRCMKSLLVCVFWPVWVWIKFPRYRWLFSSYAQDLSVRDSLKCRRIIESPWFQSRWGDRFFLLSDQNEKKKFENSKTGYRLSTSTEGRGTGEGGDTVVVDDPHNVMEALRPLPREKACEWWSETMSSRLNQPEIGSKVIVMQRLHEMDLTGYVLDKMKQEGDQYVHLRIPMRFEKELAFTSPLDVVDPRVEEGELLWSDRFNSEQTRKLEINIGKYGSAGQLQQRPAPRGGGMFKRTNFKIVEESNVPKGGNEVRFWDMAATEQSTTAMNPDWTSGCKMKKVRGEYYITHIQRHRKSPAQNKEILRQTAQADGKRVIVCQEQEPGSSGKSVTDDYARTIFSGFIYRPRRSTGSKVDRADPFASAVENGLINLVQGNWNMPFLDESDSFPSGTFDDQIDSASGAYDELNKKKIATQQTMRH